MNSSMTIWNRSNQEALASRVCVDALVQMVTQLAVAKESQGTIGEYRQWKISQIVFQLLLNRNITDPIAIQANTNGALYDRKQRRRH